jgi:hypothetical protein
MPLHTPEEYEMDLELREERQEKLAELGERVLGILRDERTVPGDVRPDLLALVRAWDGAMDAARSLGLLP